MLRAGRFAWVLLLAAALGCQSAAPAPAPTPRPAAPAAAAPTAGEAARPAAPASASRPAPLSPPVTAKVGLLSSVSDSGVYIGFERGYYRELGLELELETVPDPNTIGQLVNANRLDVGGFGVNANPFMAAARGIGVKMVADKGSLRTGFGYNSVLTRPDLYDSGQVRSVTDLRGRTISRLSQCDSHEPLIQRLLDGAGLTRNDVETTLMSFPDMNAALGNGAIDIALQIEPLATLALERGIAARLATADQIYPNQQLAALYFSPDFAARTDAAQRFMIAYVRSMRDYNDAFGKGQGRAEVAQILAKHTTVKDLGLYDRMIPAGLDPDGRLNVAGIRDDVALFGRQGCITGDVADIGRVVDESFVNYALSVLGPYQP
jgi:ABC-type nitrate/sulfonate/bicarbonate transport system substrate-binding protein